MQGNNVIALVGRVGADPEIRQVGDKSVTNLNLAVNRSTKDQSGNYITDWFNCEFWGRTGETVVSIVSKGSLISVVGSIQIQKWQDQSGNNRSKPVVSGRGFQILSKKENNSQSSYSPSNNSSNDFMSDFDDMEQPPF